MKQTGVSELWSEQAIRDEVAYLAARSRELSRQIRQNGIAMGERSMLAVRTAASLLKIVASTWRPDAGRPDGTA